MCLEPCPIKPEIMIGSMNCSKCEYYWKGSATFMNNKGFIKCKKL